MGDRANTSYWCYGALPGAGRGQGHCDWSVRIKRTEILRLFIAGGFTGPAPTSRVYSLVDDSWESMADINTARGWHACGYRDNKLYVMGGYSAASYLSSTEVLDLATGVWAAGPAPAYPAYDGRTVHYGGQLYLFGGYGSDGMVVRLSEDGSSWEDVAQINGNVTRPWTPTPVIRSDSVGC